MWNEPQVPRVAIQTIPVDENGKMLLMRRSQQVRSAKGVWSFPSGLHEIGETWNRGIARELEEEYSLLALEHLPIGIYENIGDCGYHWFIMLATTLVTDVRKSINNEPNKHDRMLHVDVDLLSDWEFYREHPFHKSFMDYAQANHKGIHRKVKDFIDDI